MGLLDSAQNLITGGGTKNTNTKAIEDNLDGLSDDIKKKNKDFQRHLTPYNIKYMNWYRTVPYAFQIARIGAGLGGGTDEYIPPKWFFPINPENLTISTPFAVNITPTIGGVVEEHSGSVFYNITISGTTGVLPEIDFIAGSTRDTFEELRPSADNSKDGLLGNSLYGFGQATLAALNTIKTALLGNASRMVDSKRNRVSGYTAFHYFYKFLWLYHASKSVGSKDMLRFINYKDNNQYNCAIQNFTLNRNKENPMVYFYTINMKAWNLSALNVGFQDKSDRLKQLGLKDEPSLKAKLYRVITTAKTTLNAVKGLTNAIAQDAIV
jgi:hypothetical protein